MTELVVKYKRSRYETFWKVKSITELGLANFLSDLYRNTDVDKLILKIERFKFAYSEDHAHHTNCPLNKHDTNTKDGE